MVDRPISTGMSSITRTIAILFLVLAILNSFDHAQARANKRHPSLDPLASSDERMSIAGKQAHSVQFHKRLTHYAHHLDTAADAMLLQLETLERHEEQHHQQQTQGVDFDIEHEQEGDSESEVDAESDAESEVATATVAESGVNLSEQLHRFFAAGDARAVAHILELKHHLTLNDHQRTSMIQHIDNTMQVVLAGVKKGDPLDHALLETTLDTMIGQVVFPLHDKSMLEHKVKAEFWSVEEPPQWIVQALDQTHTSLQDQSSPLYGQLMDQAKQRLHQRSHAEASHTIPSDSTLAESFRKAESNLAGRRSTLGEELRFLAIDSAAHTDPEAMTSEFASSMTPSANIANDPAASDGMEWMNDILATAIADVESGTGEFSKQLEEVADEHAILHPDAESTDDIAHSMFTKIDEDELEARLRFQARKVVWTEMIDKNKAECQRLAKRGKPCDMKKFIADAATGLKTIMSNKVPETLTQKADSPLGASPQLDIARDADTTPESVRDVELSIKNKVDVWFDLPGRQQKQLSTKDRYVSDLLDAEGERCPKKCSMHGQCLMDMNSTVKSPSGSQNVHPYHCICDTGYVGDACQIKLDMHLRWLLTEGAAPFPKCCKVCDAQRTVPMKWDDIPTYNNPFSSFAPECLPFPRISAYSREDGSHELVKGRRPDPKCSHPLGEITRSDPIVALELAADLSSAQSILQSSLLEDMSFLSADLSNMHKMSAEARATHKQRLSTASRSLKDASETAKRAAEALAKKLHIEDIAATKYSDIDLDQLLDDYREMPNEMEECCLFCQNEPEPLDFMTNGLGGSAVGPNAILSQDPRLDTQLDAEHRRQAMKRQEKRYAQLTDTVPKSDQECCVVCPYNFREVERLEEAAYLRKQAGGHASEVDPDKSERDRVFLEVFAEVDAQRRRRHEPRECCPACPSQFLIAHAFPAGPWTTTRTMPNTGP